VKRGLSETHFKIDKKSLDALEFFKILDLLEKNAWSPVGKECCRQVRPCADLSEIKKTLAEIEELKRLDAESGPLPGVDIQDTRDTLNKIRVKGTVLDPTELLAISLNVHTCQNIKTFFRSIDGAFPHLQTIIGRLSVCRDLGQEIQRCLDPDGGVRDEASSPLKSLRGRKRELRNRIQREMESLLNQSDLQTCLRDRVITQRNGRAVLLVRPEFRGRIKGIVHDYSHSRMTLFIEPISVVEMHNDLNLLLDEEREEENRILEQLTEGVRKKRDDLWQDLEYLGELDMLIAKMKLGRLLHGIQPEIDESGVIRLTKARHPLLFMRKPDETVPIDIMLEKDHPVLVISGANAGGKTVALKTLGLLAVMFQSGMEIPAGEGSRMAVYKKIFAKVGDEQSIGADLSTFSAHLIHFNEILEEADGDSLILVDEIGGGTNVTEGAALAMGILDHLKEKGAAVVVTTHLEPLKGYGYVTPGVINVSVEFDPGTLEPRYRLSYGTSAPSYAFLLAEKMGVAGDMLDRAREYQSKIEGSSAAMIQRLEELQVEVGRERDRLRKLQEEVLQRRDRLQGLIKRIRERRDQILLRVEERGQMLLRHMEGELEKLNHGLSPGGPGKKKPERKLREIRTRFSSQVKGKRSRRPSPENLRPGEWVRVLDLDKEGTVSQVHETIGLVEVFVGRFKIKTSLQNLERVENKGEDPKKPEVGLSVVPTVISAAREINVIGLTVEEALPVVDKFIDTALLENLQSVSVIHGIGSGRLGEAIQRYLRGHRAVRAVTYGDPMGGGYGVTMAKLGWDGDDAVAEQKDDHRGKVTADS
jgi:DNA mismatch repair protein MutS2